MPRNLVANLITPLAALVTLAFATVAGAQQTAPLYHLPWAAGQAVFVTQDCNDSCCGDHVGHNEYAWDFATQGSFEVLAPRDGTIVHVKMSSNRGGDSSDVDTANYLVIDHGDGTASVMLHLAFGTLDPHVHCGAFVRAGQRLATTGATGWASGNHLHYQVNRIPPGMNRTCECGPDGLGCSAAEAHWDLFWSRDDSSTSVPISFAEWSNASVCNDRHDDNVLVSRNVMPTRDASLVAVHADEPGRFQPLAGRWSAAPGGVAGDRYRAADPSADASAMLSLEGRVPGPGLYEVWVGTPAPGRNVGVQSVRVEVIGRGERGVAMLSQASPGGGYRALPGRFKLSGRAGEGVVFAASARAAQSLAVDSVVLRRVGDAGALAEGAACHASSQCAGDAICSDGVCADGSGSLVAQRASATSATPSAAATTNVAPTARPAAITPAPGSVARGPQRVGGGLVAHADVAAVHTLGVTRAGMTGHGWLGGLIAAVLAGGAMASSRVRRRG